MFKLALISFIKSVCQNSLVMSQENIIVTKELMGKWRWGSSERYQWVDQTAWERKGTELTGNTRESTYCKSRIVNIQEKGIWSKSNLLVNLLTRRK